MPEDIGAWCNGNTCLRRFLDTLINSEIIIISVFVTWVTEIIFSATADGRLLFGTDSLDRRDCDFHLSPKIVQ